MDFDQLDRDQMYALRAYAHTRAIGALIADGWHHRTSDAMRPVPQYAPSTDEMDSRGLLVLTRDVTLAETVEWDEAPWRGEFLDMLARARASIGSRGEPPHTLLDGYTVRLVPLRAFLSTWADHVDSVARLPEEITNVISTTRSLFSVEGPEGPFRRVEVFGSRGPIVPGNDNLPTIADMRRVVGQCATYVASILDGGGTGAAYLSQIGVYGYLNPATNAHVIVARYDFAPAAAATVMV